MITTTVRRFAVLAGMLALLGAAGIPAASAAQAPVGLGTAAPFAVLAGTTVTNTGPSVISGELGVSPGKAVTGFPPGTSGVQHKGDAVALQAQKDLVTAYNDAAGRTPVHTVSADLGGQTLAPGVYKAASALSLTGTVTLKGSGVFIFQAGSTLITASGSRVKLTGGASPCDVFWQVGSSATLGTGSKFAGTVMALTSIAVQSATSVQGRVLARNGAVTLDNNVINASACTGPSPTPTPTPTPTATSSSPAPTPTATSTSPGPFPSGPPATGAGGSLHSGNGVLVAVALAALAGVAILVTGIIRRRRIRSG